MSFVTASKNSFSVKAYVGDEKTLLAFNFSSQDKAKNLAGFTIFCQPPGGVSGYYLQNFLQFEDPSKHAQVAGDPHSSVNAPFQKYRWTHFPGTAHQGTSPALGEYTFTVTPRYFDSNGSMQALDSTLSVAVKVTVGPFKKGAVMLGFTRGYIQSQAYVHHFGAKTPVVPKTKQLQFNTSTQAGTNNGQPVTFAQIYDWMGETAREQVFYVLNQVLNNSSLTLKVFAYDLNEPDVVKILLTLAQQGRVRVILDDAPLHVTQKGAKVKTPEDQFTDLFQQQKKGPSAIVRGHFGRYSHDKILIVSNQGGSAIQVLTGSTNFSLTGLYVNANHVLVFQDTNVAAQYDKVFEESWQALSNNKANAAATAFSKTALATQPYEPAAGFVPRMDITFSPHRAADVDKILGGISDRIKQETHAAKGNVIFAVMQLTMSGGPVCQTLGALHATQSVYSYGISDAPTGIFLYASGSLRGFRSPASRARSCCRRHSTKCRARRGTRFTTNSWSAALMAMIPSCIAGPRTWRRAAKPPMAIICWRSTMLMWRQRSPLRPWDWLITTIFWIAWPIRRRRRRRRKPARLAGQRRLRPRRRKLRPRRSRHQRKTGARTDRRRLRRNEAEI